MHREGGGKHARREDCSTCRPEGALDVVFRKTQHTRVSDSICDGNCDIACEKIRTSTGARNTSRRNMVPTDPANIVNVPIVLYRVASHDLPTNLQEAVGLRTRFRFYNIQRFYSGKESSLKRASGKNVCCASTVPRGLKRNMRVGCVSVGGESIKIRSSCRRWPRTATYVPGMYDVSLELLPVESNNSAEGL